MGWNKPSSFLRVEQNAKNNSPQPKHDETSKLQRSVLSVCLQYNDMPVVMLESMVSCACAWAWRMLRRGINTAMASIPG